MNYKLLTIFVLMLVLGGHVFCVELDTVNLSPTEIKSTRLYHYKTGVKLESLDTNVIQLYQSASLADIIEKQSTFHVKTYGSGSLATLSIRGTSSSENAVLWNGINLNSPVLGDFDLSNIPVALFDNITLQYGGGSALYGSGVIGGSIHLENNPTFNKRLSVKANASLGSFSNYGTSGKFTYANNRVETSTAFNYRSGKNNYPFSDGLENKRLTNAAIMQYGIMEDFAIKTTEKSFLKASVWYQYNEKQIAPTIVMSESTARSKSEDVRTALQWKYIGRITTINAKGGYFYNLYKYADDKVIDSNVETNSGILEVDVQNKVLEGFYINVGGNLSYFNAMQANYGTNKEEYHLSLFASVKYDFQRIPLSLNLNLRQQLVDWNAVPFTPSFGIESNFWKGLFVSASIGSNYRTPTFNERYWQPGGNPDIKAEQSLNEDLQFGWKSPTHILKEISATLYNSNVKDKILWVPVSGIIWSPMNVESVWARGLEAKVNVGQQIRNWRYNITLGYSFTLSTNQTTGLQLIYIPKHNGYINLGFAWRYLELNYSQKLTSRSYTTSDNESWVKGYTTADLSLSGDILVKNSSFRLTGTLRNLFNTDYQIIKYYPMPGINFELSIAYKFN